MGYATAPTALLREACSFLHRFHNAGSGVPALQLARKLSQLQPLALLHLSLKLKQLKSKAWGEVEAEGEAGPQAALRAEAARPHAEALSPAGPPLPAFSFSISGLKAARQRERSSMKGVGAGPSGRGGFCYTS